MTSLTEKATFSTESAYGPGIVLCHAGVRYWPASILPALIGTTLPFWLNPPGFSFRSTSALEFLSAVVFAHAGFYFLHTLFESEAYTSWSKTRLLIFGLGCIGIASLIGLHLNRGLTLHAGVYGNIFIVYGIATLLVGALYVVPPLAFYRRLGGEIVVAEGLAMLPLLGAFIVQVGDITRSVYLASLPVIAATWLWVWTGELATREMDEKSGRRTLVLEFGSRFSGRWGVLILSAAVLAALALAAVSGSIPPMALVGLTHCVLLWRLARRSWKAYDDRRTMETARRHASLIHFAVCMIIAVSPFLSRLL